jgi:hypothetical protein
LPAASTVMPAGGSALSDVAALFEQAFRLARERFALFALSVIVLTGLGVAAEVAPERIHWPILILAILGELYLKAIVVASALGLDPISAVGRRILPLISWGVLATVGFLVGLMLLVVPGFVLLLRWSIALPILLIEERGAIESLGRSWQLTAVFWRLAIAVPAVAMLAYVPYWLLDWFTPYPSVPVPMILAAHFYVSLLIAFQWLLCVALYRHVRGKVPDVGLPEIFS